MARLLSIANSNWLTATTWGLVDPASALDSEAGITTTTTSYVASSASTPGAITISGFAVKVRNKSTGGGTFSAELYNSTLTASVAGTEVTINVADISVPLVAETNEGTYLFLKLASPVLLLAANNYQVRVKSSVNATVTVYRDGTAGNWSRLLVTTTTQAPVAADILYVCGEHTGAGTGADIDVPMNETAATDYGSISIGSRGKLTVPTTASTAFVLKTSGIFNVYGGGVHDWTMLAATSTIDMTIDCTTNVEFGYEVRNNSTSKMTGATKTTTKTLLNTDEAAAATVIGVVSTSGWAVNDELGFPSTSRTATESEKKSILTVDSAVQVTLTAGLTNAHSGTSPTQGEVINLTRSIRIHGASAALQAYVHIEDSPTLVDWDYVELYWMGSATTDKEGVKIDAIDASVVNVQFCSFHDFIVTGSSCWMITSSSGGTWSNNVSYDIASRHLLIQATSGTPWIFDGNWGIKAGINAIFDIGDAGCTFTNNVAAGGTSKGINLAETDGTVGTFSGNSAHSNAGFNFTCSSLRGGTIGTINTWRSNIYGASFNSIRGGTVIDGLTSFGNTTANIELFGCGGVLFKNITLNAGVTLTCPIGWQLTTSNGPVVIDNASMGATTTHSTGDANVFASAFQALTFVDSLFGSATEVANQANLVDEDSYIASINHDQVVGEIKTWKSAGRIELDTSVFRSASPSQKLVPSSASRKLASRTIISGFCVAVNNGATVTPAVYVREDATYNGARARLVLRLNPALGIDADTVIDTATAASDEAWEQLTGTTAAAATDGVFEFYVDVDGTAGQVNVDDWSAVGQVTGGQKYWMDGGPFGVGDPVGGGSPVYAPFSGSSLIRM